MQQATLRTARLDLSPLRDMHVEHEIELDSDPEVVRFLFARARGRADVEAAHRARMARAVDGLGLWAGFLRSEPGAFVGLWMLTPPDGASQPKVPGEAELGYRLLRRHWRQGLAREGSQELLRHGFDDLRLERIFAQTMAVNVASRATMTSLGMRFVRAFHEHYDEPVAGAEHGEVEYELCRQDWLARRP